MYLDQFINTVGFWFEELAHRLQPFIADYGTHWVLGSVVYAVILPLQGLFWQVSLKIYDISDSIYALNIRQLQDRPWAWVVNNMEGHFPGFAWLVSDPVNAMRHWFSNWAFPGMPITGNMFLWVIDCGEEVFPGFRLFILDPADYIRRGFSRLVFPGMSVAEDVLTWVLDCGDEIFPGFRLFILDPIDHLRRIFSRLVFPNMPVSDDLLTWVLDCGDEIFPGFRLFVLDPDDYIMRKVAGLFGARVDLFQEPGKWVIYWVKNALVDFREEYRAWLLPTLERLLRYIWEGVF